MNESFINSRHKAGAELRKTKVLFGLNPLNPKFYVFLCKTKGNGVLMFTFNMMSLCPTWLM